MRIEIVYCHPLVANGDFQSLAEQFVASYLANDPLVDHETTIVCNGGTPNLETRALFSVLPGLKFVVHDNTGWDIGGFMRASSESSADMIVFFGAYAYVKGRGWLHRMAESFAKHGEAQYGAMANRGNMMFGVQPHIRTTGFWCSPELFNAYPWKVTTPSQRYPFEHGPNCFTTWVTRKGLKSWMVTHVGEYLWEHWDMAPGGFHNGDQRNMLSGDRVSMPPHWHCA